MDLYLLKKLYELFEIPVYVEQDGKAVVSLPEEKQKFSPFFCDPNFAEELVLFAESRNTPFLYLEDEKIYYGIFCDVQKNVYFFGPLARKTMKHKEIKEYLFRHQVRVERKIMKCDLGIISKILVINMSPLPLKPEALWKVDGIPRKILSIISWNSRRRGKVIIVSNMKHICYR